MMRQTRRDVLAWAAIGIGSAPVAAHGFHAAFTVIEHNARTGALEILHRIFIQDLEIVLAARTGIQLRLDDSAHTQKLIEDYLLDVFHLGDGEGRRLRPDWVGLKLEVDTAFVYREIKTAAAPTRLVVDDQILTETNQGQVNSVNVTIAGRTRTAVFMINDPPQTLEF